MILDAARWEHSWRPLWRNIVEIVRRHQAGSLRAVGVVATLFALALAIDQLSRTGTVPLADLFARSAVFWVAFGGTILVEPLADAWIMWRRFGIGTESIGPLLRKQTLNTLLFSCAGDALFGGWLRQRLGDGQTALALMCDLTIMSALVNNLMTIMLLVVMWAPLSVLTGSAYIDGHVLIAVVAVAAIPAVLAIVRTTLSPSTGLIELGIILTLRTAIYVMLLLAAWHFALPQVPVQSWLLLLTLKMVVSRLPILPNKDLAFASGVAIVLGPNEAIASVSAGLALLTILAEALCLLVPLRLNQRPIAKVPSASSTPAYHGLEAASARPMDRNLDLIRSSQERYLATAGSPAGNGPVDSIDGAHRPAVPSVIAQRMSARIRARKDLNDSRSTLVGRLADGEPKRTASLLSGRSNRLSHEQREVR
ncbi:hypothetical protein ACLB0R_04595 [Sphingomonas sp. GlSt437]